MEILNRTPFVPFVFDFIHKDDVERHTIILKGTYHLIGEGTLQLAQNANPLRFSDEYHGELGASSIKWETDLIPMKNRTDVIFNALLHSTYACGDSAFSAEICVNDTVYALRFHGERYWEYGFTGWKLTPGTRFDTLPLKYEYAYGGSFVDCDQTIEHPYNPVGTGYYNVHKLDRRKRYAAPRIETPAQPLKSPSQSATPAPCGPIAKTWLPRLHNLGTVDEQWRKIRFPLLPSNFNNDYFNSSTFHDGTLFQGGERITMKGFDHSRDYCINVPRDRVRVKVVTDAAPRYLTLKPDTINIDMIAKTVEIVWRAQLRRTGTIRQVEICLQKAR